MKIGMIKLKKEFNYYNVKAKILLQIHDELLIEVKVDQISKTQKIVAKTLEKIVIGGMFH